MIKTLLKIIVPELGWGLVRAAENDSLGTLASFPGGPGKRVIKNNNNKKTLFIIFMYN